MVTDLLFVYGTLRSGHDNPYAKLLRANSDFLGPAIVSGSICQNGPYLAYRPEPKGEVHGELYRLRTPEETLRVLDVYEGPGYKRVLLPETGWIYQARS